METLIYHGQVIAKKNNWKPRVNPRTGRLMIVPTAEAKLQESALVRAFTQGIPPRWTGGEMASPESFEVEIEIWNRDQRRHDLDNQASTILDALVKAGVLPDDNQKVVSKLTTFYAGIDADDPRAKVTIKRKEGR